MMQEPDAVKDNAFLPLLAGALRNFKRETRVSPKRYERARLLHRGGMFVSADDRAVRRRARRRARSRRRFLAGVSSIHATEKRRRYRARKRAGGRARGESVV